MQASPPRSMNLACVRWPIWPLHLAVLAPRSCMRERERSTPAQDSDGFTWWPLHQDHSRNLVRVTRPTHLAALAPGTRDAASRSRGPVTQRQRMHPTPLRRPEASKPAAAEGTGIGESGYETRATPAAVERVGSRDRGVCTRTTTCTVSRYGGGGAMNER